MARADAEALQKISPLLRQLREIKGVAEKSTGVYYARRDAFVHFHDDAGVLSADLKKAGGSGFDRFALASPAEQRKFIDEARLRARRFEEE